MSRKVRETAFETRNCEASVFCWLKPSPGLRENASLRSVLGRLSSKKRPPHRDVVKALQEVSEAIAHLGKMLYNSTQFATRCPCAAIPRRR
jgi:hypothetical protein